LGQRRAGAEVELHRGARVGRLELPAEGAERLGQRGGGEHRDGAGGAARARGRGARAGAGRVVVARAAGRGQGERRDGGDGRESIVRHGAETNTASTGVFGG